MKAQVKDHVHEKQLEGTAGACTPVVQVVLVSTFWIGSRSMTVCIKGLTFVHTG